MSEFLDYEGLEHYHDVAAEVEVVGTHMHLETVDREAHPPMDLPVVTVEMCFNRTCLTQSSPTKPLPAHTVLATTTPMK